MNNKIGEGDLGHLHRWDEITQIVYVIQEGGGNSAEQVLYCVCVCVLTVDL